MLGRQRTAVLVIGWLYAHPSCITQVPFFSHCTSPVAEAREVCSSVLSDHRTLDFCARPYSTLQIRCTLCIGWLTVRHRCGALVRLWMSLSQFSRRNPIKTSGRTSVFLWLIIHIHRSEGQSDLHTALLSLTASRLSSCRSIGACQYVAAADAVSAGSTLLSMRAFRVWTVCDLRLLARSELASKEEAQQQREEKVH